MSIKHEILPNEQYQIKVNIKRARRRERDMERVKGKEREGGRYAVEGKKVCNTWIKKKGGKKINDP